jgi:hypothetical protein
MVQSHSKAEMSVCEFPPDLGLSIVRGSETSVAGDPMAGGRIDKVLRHGVEIGRIKNIVTSSGDEMIVSYCGSMVVLGGGPLWVSQTYDMLQSYDEPEEPAFFETCRPSGN